MLNAALRRFFGNNARRLLATLLVAASALSVAGCATGGRGETVLGYVTEIPPESDAQRAWRKQVVIERRAGLPILVHRGAWQHAPENTLEAYAAAMDLGADGVEIDIRRTADGVLYLFHDDTLERLTTGRGPVTPLRYAELLQLTPKEVYGRATPETRPPTLAAFLIVARQRAMLLHLDIKEPGLETDIARLLTVADVWDQVVHVNDYNSASLRADERYRGRAYAGWVPKDGTADEIRRFCEQARKNNLMVFCDDPVPVVRALGRPAPKPVPLPDRLRCEWEVRPGGKGRTRRK